ncbi:MAG: hypothetical protein ACI83W_000474 [Marinoscillum sp.]|jgi:hypothetical protein
MKDSKHMSDEAINRLVDQTINSLEGRIAADPGPYFAAKTLARANSMEQSNVVLPLFWKLAMALILVLNIGTLAITYTQTDSSTNDEIGALSADYFNNDITTYQIELAL